MSQELSFTTDRRALSRRLGGVAALTYPLVLVALALRTGFRQAGDVTGFAASFLAALLILLAQPTMWLFSFDFIDPDRLTILVVGGLTSFPLWYLGGAALAARTPRWPLWLKRYAIACAVWTAINLTVFFFLAWLAA